MFEKKEISRTKTAKWNIFFQYASIATMIISGILLVPLYLRNIDIELYGAWLATGNILAWLCAIDPGLSTLIQQRVANAYGSKNSELLSELIFAGIFISTILSLILLAVGFITAINISDWIRLTSSIDKKILENAFYIAVIGSSFQILSFSITSINQGLQSSLGIGLIYTLIHLIDLILVLILLWLDFGLLSLGYSLLFRGIGLLIGNVIYLKVRMNKEDIRLSYSIAMVKKISKLMPFTFFSQFSNTVSNNIDSFVVGTFLGAENVTRLMLTKKSLEISKMIILRPSVALMPSLSHLAGEGNIEKLQDITKRYITFLIWILVLFAGGIICFNKKFMTLWVGESLYAGDNVSLILTISFFMIVVTSTLTNLLISLGDIKNTSIATLIQSLIFIPLIIFGTKYFGVLGCVLAPLISLLLFGIWYFPTAFIKKIKFQYKEKINLLREMIYSAIAFISVLILFLYFDFTLSLINFISEVAIFCIFYFMILWIISKSFRREIRVAASKFPKKIEFKN